MAAGEDETEPTAAPGPRPGRPGGGVQVGRGVARVARRFSTKHVDRAVARGGDDPSRRARGHPGLWPSVERGGERVLHRLLGEIDVPEDADEHGHRAAMLRAEHAFDLRPGKRRHAAISPGARRELRRARPGTVAPRWAAGSPAPSSWPTRGLRP